MHTLHRWLSRADRPDHPDRLVFDLDPHEDDFAAVREAARLLHDLLDELELPSAVMTTGSRGLHVLVPLDRRAPFDDVREFALAAQNSSPPGTPRPSHRPQEGGPTEAALPRHPAQRLCADRRGAVLRTSPSGSPRRHAAGLGRDGRPGPRRAALDPGDHRRPARRRPLAERPAPWPPSPRPVGDSPPSATSSDSRQGDRLLSPPHKTSGDNVAGHHHPHEERGSDEHHGHDGRAAA